MTANFKLLYSPIKWLVCLVFVCMMPMTMYMPTYFDFVNIASQYFPFNGVVVFSDIATLDKANGTAEIVYLSNRKPTWVLLQRYLISSVIFLTYVFFADGLFHILQYFKGTMMTEPISFFEYTTIVTGSSVFIGGLSLFISALFGNVFIGYSFSIIYWIYWNINCQTEALINPFPFIANPAFYKRPLLAIYIISLLLLVATCWLAGKSPFWSLDHLHRQHN